MTTKRIVIAASEVRPIEPRRWYIYRDSAERALKDKPHLKLHLRPLPRPRNVLHTPAWALVEIALLDTRPPRP